MFPGGGGQPAKAQGAGQPVGGQGDGAEQGAQFPFGGAPVQFHLPQSVLGMDKTLSYQQIAPIGGVDVGNAPGVPVNGDGLAEGVEVDTAVNLGEVAAEEGFDHGNLEERSAFIFCLAMALSSPYLQAAGRKHG